MRRALLVLTVLTGVLALYLWSAWSPGAPTHVLSAERRSAPLPRRLREPAEHDAVRERFGEPYVLHLEEEAAAPDAAGALFYYGASHSRDPDHPQIADIEARWDAFRPTVALCEGRSRGYFLGRPFVHFAGLPEPAWVHALARRHGVPLASLEPTYADEVALLCARFPAEAVALYFTLRVYASEAGGRPDEGLALDLARKRTAVPGLEGALGDPLEAGTLDAAWARHGSGPDWRALTAVPASGVLGEIDRASRVVRGEHMARVLVDLVRRGERVFAVVGSGHVIRQEWALRAALGAAPAEDDPGNGTPLAAPGDGR